MKKCRECHHDISEQALACPNCGAPYPAKEKWDGWGFEYKSEATIMGLPLLHISFKYRPNRMPVPAKGIISIGQFWHWYNQYFPVRHRCYQLQPIHGCFLCPRTICHSLLINRADWLIY